VSKKKTPRPRKLLPAKPSVPAVAGELLTDVRALIDQARDATARAVNSALVLLYWGIGDRIRRDVLKEKRAGYGEQILPTLSAKLVPEYGQGYGERNLARMVKMAEVFPDGQVVGALCRQLGWSHFVEILPVISVLCEHHAHVQSIPFRPLSNDEALDYFSRALGGAGRPRLLPRGGTAARNGSRAPVLPPVCLTYLIEGIGVCTTTIRVYCRKKK
jgi:hypothetical protein